MADRQRKKVRRVIRGKAMVLRDRLKARMSIAIRESIAGEAGR
jgi:hypothetical protein